MIVLRFNLWMRVKILFGWRVQVEIWPRTAQAYWEFVLPPWDREERVFRNAEAKYQMEA